MKQWGWSRFGTERFCSKSLFLLAISTPLSCSQQLAIISATSSHPFWKQGTILDQLSQPLHNTATTWDQPFPAPNPATAILEQAFWSSGVVALGPLVDLILTLL